MFCSRVPGADPRALVGKYSTAVIQLRPNSVNALSGPFLSLGLVAFKFCVCVYLFAAII